MLWGGEGAGVLCGGAGAGGQDIVEEDAILDWAIDSESSGSAQQGQHTRMTRRTRMSHLS